MDFQHVSHSDNFHNILCNPPGADFFPLLFLSPSSPVCFWPCKMLVALLKYCSALSALFFLPSFPISLFFSSPLCPSLPGWVGLYPPPPTSSFSCCCCWRWGVWWWWCRGVDGWGREGRGGSRSSRDPMTWVRHVTVAQERKSIHERMRSTGVDYRLGPWLLEGWRGCRWGLGGLEGVCMCVCGGGGKEGCRGREARLSSPLSPASPPLTKHCLNLDPSHQPSLGF